MTKDKRIEFRLSEKEEHLIEFLRAKWGMDKISQVILSALRRQAKLEGYQPNATHPVADEKLVENS